VRVGGLIAVAAILVLGACGGSGADTVTQAEAPATEPAAVASGAATTEEPATTEAEPTTQEATTESAPEPEPGLPEFTAGYQEWPKLNAAPIPPNPEGDPHLGVKQVFTSEPAEAGGLYPNGTIIVKESVRPDADFIGLVAIMRKEQGADPEHNDWIFDEYTRSTAAEPFSLTASDEVCWNCHMGAAQTDYVWVDTLGLSR
jgi:hypothetical protein